MTVRLSRAAFKLLWQPSAIVGGLAACGKRKSNGFLRWPAFAARLVAHCRLCVGTPSWREWGGAGKRGWMNEFALQAEARQKAVRTSKSRPHETTGCGS
jgi:hypothetical protein